LDEIDIIYIERDKTFVILIYLFLFDKRPFDDS